MSDEKIKALAKFLNESKEDIEEQWNNVFSIGRREYFVLTDDEANAVFQEYIENYIDECIVTELPDQYKCYFDEEKFIRDIKLSDGRGPTLASYNG